MVVKRMYFKQVSNKIYRVWQVSELRTKHRDFKDDFQVSNVGTWENGDLINRERDSLHWGQDEFDSYLIQTVRYCEVLKLRYSAKSRKFGSICQE